MSRSKKKNRQPLGTSRVASATRAILEAIEPRILMTARPTPSPTATCPISPPTRFPRGSSTTVNIYLDEALNGQPSIVNAEFGLLGAGFEVESESSAASQPMIVNPSASGSQTATIPTFSTPAGTDYDNPNANNPTNEVDIDAAVGSSATSGPTAPANGLILIGTVQITAGTLPGTTVFDVGADGALFGSPGSPSYGNTTLTFGTADDELRRLQRPGRWHRLSGRPALYRRGRGHHQLRRHHRRSHAHRRRQRCRRDVHRRRPSPPALRSTAAPDPTRAPRPASPIMREAPRPARRSPALPPGLASIPSSPASPAIPSTAPPAAAP